MNKLIKKVSSIFTVIALLLTSFSLPMNVMADTPSNGDLDGETPTLSIGKVKVERKVTEEDKSTGTYKVEIKVTNTSEREEARGVRVSDEINNHFEILSAGILPTSGVTVSGNTIAYDIGTLPKEESRTLSFFVKIKLETIEVDPEPDNGNWYKVSDNLKLEYKGADDKSKSYSAKVYWDKTEYTVKYYKDSEDVDGFMGSQSFADSVEVVITLSDVTKEMMLPVGYEIGAINGEPLTLSEVKEDNVISILYVKKECTYKIIHVEKDNETNILEVQEETGLYGDEIDVKAKSFSGYKYDSQTETTITLDLGENTVYVYYEEEILPPQTGISEMTYLSSTLLLGSFLLILRKYYQFSK